MTTHLAIDPGPTESGWVVIDVDTRRPLKHGKTPNAGATTTTTRAGDAA